MRFLTILISSFFYVGYLPFVPGTFGSIAGLILTLSFLRSPVVHLYAVVVTAVIGFLVCGRAERFLQRKDHGSIVIDEVCGMMLALLWVPLEPRLIALGFFLFRGLDTVKPFPAGRLQEMKGAAGVMMDDVVAALYTNVILQAVARLASLSAS